MKATNKVKRSKKGIHAKTDIKQTNHIVITIKITLL